MVESVPQCNRRAGDSVELGSRARGISVRRSALLVATGQRRPSGSILVTGRRTVRIGAPVFSQNRQGRPIERRDHLAAVRGLRPIGRLAPTRAELPRAAVPRGELRRMRRIERAHARTGSVAAAAKALGASRAEVRETLRFGAISRKLRPIRSFRCSSGRAPGTRR